MPHSTNRGWPVKHGEGNRQEQQVNPPDVQGTTLARPDGGTPVSEQSQLAQVENEGWSHLDVTAATMISATHAHGDNGNNGHHGRNGKTPV